ncbi:MAG: hypothetical protein Nk1A_7140 [Endomicrobiia bacterium]|nr:MAG: hypothetical protein Nk1A_7140 [Endomicrobiia bacterium]
MDKRPKISFDEIINETCDSFFKKHEDLTKSREEFWGSIDGTIKKAYDSLLKEYEDFVKSKDFLESEEWQDFYKKIHYTVQSQ